MSRSQSSVGIEIKFLLLLLAHDLNRTWRVANDRLRDATRKRLRPVPSFHFQQLAREIIGGTSGEGGPGSTGNGSGGAGEGDGSGGLGVGGKGSVGGGSGNGSGGVGTGDSISGGRGLVSGCFIVAILTKLKQVSLFPAIMRSRKLNARRKRPQ